MQKIFLRKRQMHAAKGLPRSYLRKVSHMNFIETMYGYCLLNVSEIVSIYKVGRRPTNFPYQHTINDFKEIGIYVAIKIGQDCHSLPLVTSMQIAACVHSELNDREHDPYLDLFKSIEEKDLILTEIIYEMKRQMKIPFGCIDTWDVVKTIIRKRIYQMSEMDVDDQSDD